MTIVPIGILVFGIVANVGAVALALCALLLLSINLWFWSLETREVAIGSDWLACQNVVRRNTWSVFSREEITPGPRSDMVLTVRTRRAGSSTSVGRRIDLRVPGVEAAIAELLGPDTPPAIPA